MANGFIARDDFFQVIRDDKIAFDNRRPSIQLFPASTRIVLNSKTITFPNLLTTNIYFNRSSDYGGTFPTNPGTTYAESWTALIGQEWGYGETSHNEVYYPQAPQNSIAGPSRRDLAQELLGTVPAATTYLDVRVRLRRTKLTPIFMNRERPAFFPQENEWINLVGGSCPVEYHFPLMRMFEIVRVGTSVYLRRYQSVQSRAQSTYTRLYAQNGGSMPWVFGVATSGWRYNNYQTANWNSPPAGGAWLAVLHQTKGPDINGNKRPPWQSGSTNSCAVPGYGGTPITDLSTVLSADIIIHPGRYAS